MILWCAYCQRFIGERPPYDNFMLTHGMCKRCKAAGRFHDRSALAGLRTRIDFHRELLRAASRGEVPHANEVVERALQLGIQPVDLLISFIQPALYEIGARWATHDVTVADEHRFTAFCSRVLEILDAAPVAPSRGSGAPALLIAAPGNYHSLGIRVVDFWLRSQGVPTYLVYPSLPATEVVGLAGQLHPRFVGFSMAQATQLSAIEQLLPQLSAPVLVGGPALRAEGPLPSTSGITFITSIEQLTALLAQPCPP